jgi:hypothetical protein
MSAFLTTIRIGVLQLLLNTGVSFSIAFDRGGHPGHGTEAGGLMVGEHSPDF